MFGIFMPPGHEDIVEDHYEDIPCWESEQIAMTCLSDLLNEMMDIQYTPSKELAEIYFLNNEISPSYSDKICDIESIEMVKKYPDQLKAAFCEAYGDKLILAANTLVKVLKKKNYKILCTKQLKEVVTFKYTSLDKEELEQNTRKLWWEFKLELNKISEDTNCNKWYWYHDKDPAKDFVIENKVTPKDIKASLISVINILRSSRIMPEDLQLLKQFCMHLLMIKESIYVYGQPKAMTQHEYSSICNYVLDKNIGWFTAWSCPENIDLSQIVMTRHIAKATRHVAKKFDKPSSYVVLQSLLKWFVVESYVIARVVKEAHGKDKDYSTIDVATTSS